MTRAAAGPLVAFFATRLSPKEPVARALRALDAASAGDANLEAQIESLLAQLEAK